MRKVNIWTDGSCLGNPGPGGWAALFIFDDDKELELSGGVEHTTNNKMELIAAIEALEHLKIPHKIELFSDSKYVVDGITKWIIKWKKKDWKKIKSRDIWERLDAACGLHDIKWTWVRGHSGDINNERVDKLAVAESNVMKALFP